MYTVETLFTALAVSASFIGALLLPTALLILVHEGLHQLRSHQADWQVDQRTSAAPAPSVRH